jgi:hypothetical protein
LRGRTEQTQLEHISEASFLGKLLVSPANVRLEWKGIARYKHYSLFGLIISNEGKKFYNIDTRGGEVIKLFFFVNDDEAKSAKARNTKWRRRLSAIDLHDKVTCFVKK